MGFILNIDTAVQTASICLAQDGKVISHSANPFQRDHAAWLQPAIVTLLKQSSLTVKDLDAIAVSAGPGSYTGLRVGMSSAKGLCYALNIPLITINTLQMMAAAALPQEAELLCPMIDARRMEVFTAVYDHQLTEVIAPYNCILTHLTYSDLLEKHTILFFGNGSGKFKELINHHQARFKEIEAGAIHMALLSNDHFREKDFADLAYCEPFYGKDFFSPTFIAPNKPQRT